MSIDISTYKSPSHLEKLEASLPDAKKHYSQRDAIKTFKSIGSSGSMFRVFGGIDKPSFIYKKWAFAQTQSKEFEREVLSLETQEQFESFHSALGDSLSNDWDANASWNDKARGLNPENPRGLTPAQKFKLLDVFIKRACELKLPHSMMNDKLLKFGHVPLDSLVFNALVDIFSGIFLLRGRTMGDVKTEEAYCFYQELIRELMANFGSSPLHFEYYAWNLARQEDQN